MRRWLGAGGVVLDMLDRKEGWERLWDTSSEAKDGQGDGMVSVT